MDWNKVEKGKSFGRIKIAPQNKISQYPEEEAFFIRALSMMGRGDGEHVLVTDESTLSDFGFDLTELGELSAKLGMKKCLEGVDYICDILKWMHHDHLSQARMK